MYTYVHYCPLFCSNVTNKQFLSIFSTSVSNIRYCHSCNIFKAPWNKFSLKHTMTFPFLKGSCNETPHNEASSNTLARICFKHTQKTKKNAQNAQSEKRQFYFTRDLNKILFIRRLEPILEERTEKKTRNGHQLASSFHLFSSNKNPAQQGHFHI